MEQKKIINEYDATKHLINKLRRLNESRLNEDDFVTRQDTTGAEDTTATQEQQSDFVVVNNVEVKMLSTDSTDMKLDDDQKVKLSNLIDNFKQQVNQIVTFDPGFTINQEQIRLDGSLDDQDINFVHIAGKDAGVYINAEMLKLETEVGNLLEKLAKFQSTFETSMAPLIQNRKEN